MMRAPWRSLSIVSFSLLSTILAYGLATSPSEVNAELVISSPQILSAQNSPFTGQGGEISLNGRKFPVSWTQWQQGSSIRTAISDTGAMAILGVELLSTKQPAVQPVRWFSTNSEQFTVLPTRFLAPYRYLDLTDLLQAAGAQLRTSGHTLSIDFPPAQIENIRQGNQTWGKRIVIDLNRPTTWQVSQTKTEGVVIIAGTAAGILSGGTGPSPDPRLNPRQLDGDEDDLGSGPPRTLNSQLFALESGGGVTKVKVNLPTAYGLRVFSLANPHRLVIDVRPDVMTPRQIAWTEGLTWHQQLVSLPSGVFPVNWLAVDLRSPRISLKPITGNPNSREGIEPILTAGRLWQAAAAINGGFFNRNNKLPLGAIRQDGRWLSGPILNRGAIAWNEQGKVTIDRLSLRETLITSTGKRLPVIFLNSGYLEKGIARYTSEWGTNYRTLTDNETVVVVRNNQVIAQKRAGKAGNEAFPLPKDGYLLTIRKNKIAASDLAVGTQLNLESTPLPANFANYPQILGGGPLLLKNRRIVLNAAVEKFSKAFQQQKASRSAIGVTSQGILIMAAVHNRVGGRGASLPEMAQIMQQLGAVDALNLDGGSSTSLALGGQLIDRSPVTAARVHNGIGVFVSPSP